MRRFLAGIIFLVFVGCMHDEAARYYADAKYPAKNVNEVEVLRGEPARPYEVIADFQARGATEEDMREKAAAIGADAVIVTYLGGARAYKDEWADIDSSNTYSSLAATAILYIVDERKK